jgi:TRAP-type C4-dicarboxylate transport system permease small subunit
MRFVFVTLARGVMGIVMLAGVAICFANVVARYLFGYALFWAEEVMVFLIIWGVFIGVAAAAYERAHLNMDLFSNSFRGTTLQVLNAVLVAVLLACCVFMIAQSWQVVTLFYQGGIKSVSAGVPKWISHSALPVGFALMALAVLSRLRLYLHGRD